MSGKIKKKIYPRKITKKHEVWVIAARFSSIQKSGRDSLMVQWLRNGLSSQGTGFDPWLRERRFGMPRLRPDTAK